ncbi:MAG: hypothetical protein V3W41_22230 [Planctomycetota bacterium]
MKPLISSVRVERLGGHEHVHVWTRGAKSGVLIVGVGEGVGVGVRLLGPEAMWTIGDGIEIGVAKNYEPLGLSREGAFDDR